MDLQMGLAETMKNIAKGIQTEINNAPFNGVGYVTEKLYMLLQLYIQNKGWNPSVELLQCFTELKEASMLPSASYLQMLASRVTLDSQGRLILRENGKIILPYEHFANAVMLKHMNGPHGLHLNVDATVRAVMDSYTIGRDEFGMEKEFIVEVVQNCPNPTCRYYKTQLPAASAASSSHSKSNSYISESHSSKASVNSSGTSNNPNSTSTGGVSNRSATPNNNNAPSETPASLPQSSTAGGSNSTPSTGASTSLLSLPIDLTNVFEANLRSVMAASGAADLAKLSAVVKGGGGRSGLSITRTSSNDILQQAIRNEANNRRQMENETRRQLEAETRRLESETRRLESETRKNISNTSNSTGGNSNETDEMSSVTSHKLSDFLKANIESLDSLNKDLYAAHNGTWGGSITPPERGDSPKSRPNSGSSGGGGRPEQDALGQEKIVRAFSEIMRNMGRMKACVRPSMCKPYGKQSETLQKTLVDTIQLVQSLRSFLPPPHIAVSSWKNEDKGGVGGNGTPSLNLANIQVSAASLAAAAAVANRKPPGMSLGTAGLGHSGQLGLSTGGISGQMSLNTAAQIVSGSNLEELVEAVRQQQKAMATGD